MSGAAVFDPIFKDPTFGLRDEDYGLSVQRFWDVKTDGLRDRLVAEAKALEHSHEHGQPDAQIERSVFGFIKKNVPNPAYRKWKEDTGARIDAIKAAWELTHAPADIREEWELHMRSHLKAYRRETGLDGAGSLIEEAYRYSKSSHLWKV